jgi:hypothetical protein
MSPTDNPRMDAVPSRESAEAHSGMFGAAAVCRLRSSISRRGYGGFIESVCAEGIFVLDG